MVSGVWLAEGHLRYRVADPEGFVRAAVALECASHFAAEGCGIARWFHPAGRTRERPFVAGDPPPKIGCALDQIARETVRRFILKATDRLWHWYLYDEERVLVALFDWPQAAYIDPGLKGWAEVLQDAGILGAAVKDRRC